LVTPLDVAICGKETYFLVSNVAEAFDGERRLELLDALAEVPSVLLGKLSAHPHGFSLKPPDMGGQSYGGDLDLQTAATVSAQNQGLPRGRTRQSLDHIDQR
jgi:hypothetical protein